MAKSKSKSKKKTTSKSNKASKSRQTTNVNKTSKSTSKKVQQPKKAQAVVERPSKKTASPLKIGVAVSIIVALLIGALLIGTADDKSIKSSAKPTTNPNSQQTIKVVDPNADATPKSTGVKLQGSAGQQQQTAQGDLQKQDKANDLQPNAKIQDYENAEIN